MSRDTAERVRVIVSVALAMVPRGTRRRYSEKLTLVSDTAKDEIAESIAGSILQSFELTERVAEYGPPMGSGQLASRRLEGE